jgi:alkanesulfonate monooxygenase SsuD/methylene tetrahydromethanopterin reductase-like flavin-dependent oxidoreductase (luciferase family)
MRPVHDLRQPGATAFAIRDPLPWSDLRAIVRAAEVSGYSALFLPEITGRDALVTLGMLAGETADLLLATGVVPMRSRTLLLLAMAAATAQERSAGRLLLGIGTGDAGPGALAELRKCVGSVRALLRGESVERRGREVAVALRIATPPPVWVAALGPRAMRLAGACADGVLLNWCPPERVSFARERIAEGAAEAGRDPSEITVAVYVRCWVGEDDASAMSSLRAAAAEYAGYPAYARQFEQAGLGEESRAAARARRDGRVDEVPDALVHAVCATGDRAAERIAAYRSAGADLPVVYPVAVDDPATSIERTLLALAPG